MRTIPIGAAIAALAAISAVSAVGAQTELAIEVIDDIGAAALAKPAFACFDPLAALRLGEETSGAGEETRRAFSVGTCVILNEGATLSNAQVIEARNQRLLRGALSTTDVSVFIPEWSASLQGRVGAYDEARNEAAGEMRVIADDLLRRAGEMEQCSVDGASLGERIDSLNKRVARVEGGSKQPPTGSRLEEGGGLYSSYKVHFPDERNIRLYNEASALQKEQTAFWERCEPYRDGIDLDKDYLTYFRARA